MNVERPHPPYEDYRAALGDRDAEHAALDALRAELERERPDPAVVDAHVAKLRRHPGLAGAVASWFEHPRTQAFLAELGGAGL